jgi:hypothetical protein
MSAREMYRAWKGFGSGGVLDLRMKVRGACRTDAERVRRLVRMTLQAQLGIYSSSVQRTGRTK